MNVEQQNNPSYTNSGCKVEKSKLLMNFRGEIEELCKKYEQDGLDAYHIKITMLNAVCIMESRDCGVATSSRIKEPETPEP